jgi:hypothetical protein
MAPPRKEEPAICPVCNRDFEDAGKYRYRNLKRHIDTVHAGAKITVNNHYDHCTTNNMVILTNMGESQILALLDSKLRTTIDESLWEGKDVAVVLFERIHCDPNHPENHNVVIPNRSKNEMMVYMDGKPSIYKKKEGGRIVAETFMEKEVPVVSKELDDPAFDMAMEMRARDIDELASDIVDRLMVQNPEMRIKTVKRMVSNL